MGTTSMDGVTAGVGINVKGLNFQSDYSNKIEHRPVRWENTAHTEYADFALNHSQFEAEIGPEVYVQYEKNNKAWRLNYSLALHPLENVSAVEQISNYVSSSNAYIKRKPGLSHNLTLSRTYYKDLKNDLKGELGVTGGATLMPISFVEGKLINGAENNEQTFLSENLWGGSVGVILGLESKIWALRLDANVGKVSGPDVNSTVFSLGLSYNMLLNFNKLPKKDK
jgi:hypothetical protein